MSSSEKPPTGANDDVEKLAQGIEQTRAGMTATISAIEHRLSPSELGEQAKVQLDHVEVRVRALLKEGLGEARGILDEKLVAAKGAVHEEIVEVKGAVSELLDTKMQAAKDALHEEILEAKGAVKEQLHETKDLVTKSLSDARATLKKDIQGAITHTRQSIREATLGRVEDIATQAGDIMTTTRDTLVETIRQNPVPAALAGIGLAWLLMNRSSTHRQRTQGGSNRFEGGGFGDGEYGWRGNSGGGYGAGSSGGYGSPYGGSRGGTQEDFTSRVGGAFQSAQHAVSDTAGQVAHRAGDLAHQAGDALSSAGSAVTGAAHDAVAAAGRGLSQGADVASQVADAANRRLHDARDAAGNLVHSATDATTQFAHQAQEWSGHVAHQAQAWSGNVAHGAAAQARRVERQIETTYQSNPLALGAVALAVGAAVGYALPRTERENALLGEARGQVLDKATHLVQDASQSLLHIAGDASGAVKDVVAKATT